jgi:hypothetical protein
MFRTDDLLVGINSGTTASWFEGRVERRRRRRRREREKKEADQTREGPRIS